MRDKIVRLKNSKFLKSISILTTGSVIAQIITVVASPLITRLFSPADIGIYTYILSLANIFNAAMNGRYDLAIVSEEKQERVFPLIKLSFLFSVAMSAAVSTGYFIYFKFFSKEYADYPYIPVLIFVLLMSFGLINILTSFNNRNKEYFVMSSVYVIRTASQNIGAVIGGLLKAGMPGLLLPYVLGQFLGINRQAKMLKPHLKEVVKVSKEEMKEVMKIHYKQPLFSAPAQLLSGLSYSSVTLFIKALFNTSVVGYYSISMRVLGLPLSVISGNVSKVFFADASREYDKTGQFYNSFQKTALFLVALSIPMVLGMFFIVPPLCRPIFGEGWEVAGTYIRILSFMFGFRFITTSLTPGLIVANKQNYDLPFQVALVAIALGCYIVAKTFNLSMEEFLILISAFFSLRFFSYFLFIGRLSKKKGEIKNETD